MHAVWIKNKVWRGFTVIQLMVVLAVVGILASIASPSYREAIRKGKRTEGRAALYQLMQQEERFYSQRNSYIEFSSGAAGEEAKQFKWFSGNSPANSAYELSADACEGDTIRNCVRLIARPGTAKVDPNFDDPVCGELSLASSGEKKANSPECWR